MKPPRAGLAVAAVAALAWTGWTLASNHRATRDYAPFRQCPLDDPATNLCLFTQTESGEFAVGEKTVPIDRTITLQGGVHVVENKEREIVRDQLIAASDGETLSRTPQPVPGGLRGVVDPELLTPGLRRAFDELIGGGTGAGVTATIELAGPASSIHIDIQNLIEGQGIALALPVRVRLSNAFLGTDCYIGSSRRPISLALSTGTTNPPPPNRPLAGRVGKAQFKDDYNLTIVTGSSLVDNAFAGPAVRGCGGSGSPGAAVDRAVNAELALRAPAGQNTAILDGTLRDANAPAVRASR
jgi:hypothetical protein